MAIYLSQISPTNSAEEATNKHAAQEAAVWCLLPLALNAEAGVHSIPAFDDLTDSNLESYLPARVGVSPLVDSLAAIGIRNSPRMYAQQGIFTISHRKEVAIEDVGVQKHVWRLVIPASARDAILMQLRSLRITRLSLFPELDSVAALATEALL